MVCVCPSVYLRRFGSCPRVPLPVSTRGGAIEEGGKEKERNLSSLEEIQRNTEKWTSFFKDWTRTRREREVKGEVGGRTQGTGGTEATRSLHPAQVARRGACGGLLEKVWSLNKTVCRGTANPELAVSSSYPHHPGVALRS